MFKRFSKQAGFTLFEMLVVIFIISLLSIGVLLSYRNSRRQYALNQSIHQLVSDLRKAQNMALSGVDINDTTRYCGYGIVIDFSARPTSYYLYADESNNCDTSNNKYTPSDTLIKEIVLSNQTIFDAATLNLDVYFKSPKQTIYINADDNIGVSGTIILKTMGSATAKTITVTTSGLIQRN